MWSNPTGPRLFAMNGLASLIVQCKSAVIVWCSQRIAWVAAPSHIGRPVTNAPSLARCWSGPSDVEAPTYPFGTTGFKPMALQRLPFPTIVVASRNDQFVTFERAQFFASCWGSELEDAGNAGHLNTDAGYGPWPRGKELLRRLISNGA